MGVNDRGHTQNIRFITSSKGKRTNLKNARFKDNTTKTDFKRIYTPQMNARRDKRRLKNMSSKTKTMVTSDLDFKQSVEPINISSIKESNMSTK